MRRNIIITGFMGAGKSVVAKQLAQKLKMKFVDTDKVIEENQGMSIADIFTRYGEDYFRQQENKLVKELSQQENLVIATGGGTLLSSDNAEMLSQKGEIICLYADPTVIYNRVKRKNDRPLLRGENVLDNINKLLKERKKIYDNIKLKVDTSDLNIEEVVDRIIELLKGKGLNR
ncbi:MAG TPA: shikimate kinase [Candidatus Atribacteria bacterium]|nr:shikimate kinase [Candidatus Atribacteria bacterium]